MIPSHFSILYYPEHAHLLVVLCNCASSSISLKCVLLPFLRRVSDSVLQPYL